jgi:hypothetical protein
MKPIILLLTCLTCLNVSGQQIPNFTIDSARRTSEYYSTEFRMPHGAVYENWILSDDFKLTYIIGSDHASPRKKKVGDWLLSGDTLNFNIDPKALKYNPKYLPTARKYQSFTLKWSGISKIAPEWKKKPLIIDVNVIFLVDTEKFTRNYVYTDIVKYIESNFDKSGIAIDDKEEFFEINRIIERLIENYCEKKEIHFKIRTYFNGNLMKYL